MFTYPGPGYPPDEKLPAQERVPVYPVGPLLDAAMRLFGRIDTRGDCEHDRRRFPPLPGAHVICANTRPLAGVSGPYARSVSGEVKALIREIDDEGARAHGGRPVLGVEKILEPRNLSGGRPYT